MLEAIATTRTTSRDPRGYARASSSTSTPTPSTAIRGAGEFADPEDAAIAAEYKDLLYEFLVELPDTDRLIAYLHLDPCLAPRQIAKRLGLPLADVVRTTDRVGRRLSRFTALVADPDALCERRRDDVIAFLQTGQASPELRRHLIRCPSCSVELRRAQEQLRAALLPLLPAGAIPAASLGLLARAHRRSRRTPRRCASTTRLMRVRKLVPGGAAGGGGAAITAKVLAAGTVLSVGAAIHAVRGFQAPPHHAGTASSAPLMCPAHRQHPPPRPSPSRS